MEEAGTISCLGAELHYPQQPRSNAIVSPGQPGCSEPHAGDRGRDRVALPQATDRGRGKSAGHTQVAPAPLIARLSQALARQWPGMAQLLGPQLFPVDRESEDVTGTRDYLAPLQETSRRTPES